MSKQTFFLRSPVIQLNALRYIESLPTDQDRYLMVTIQEPTRSLEANAKMWAMLAEISAQVFWHGRKLSPENWKHIFSAAHKQQDVVPNLDGTGFVVMGQSTSKMTKREMADLITLIQAFGDERGVRFNEN